MAAPYGAAMANINSKTEARKRVRETQAKANEARQDADQTAKGGARRSTRSLLYRQAMNGRAEEAAEALPTLAIGEVEELAEAVAETELKAR